LNLKNTKQSDLKRFLSKLTKLNIYRHLRKRRNGKANPEISTNGYFESIEYFRHRFFIEKRRAERKGYEFSLIIIDLKDEEKKFNRVIDNALLKTEDIIFSTLIMVLRSTDIVVKYCPFKLAILLPDTEKEGTALVVHRINTELKEIFDQSPSDVLKILKVYSYCYPDHADEINKLIESEIITDQSSTTAVEKTVREVRSDYFKTKHSNGYSNNLKLGTFSRNTLILENPFFLLNDVFFDFSMNWQKIIKRYLDISMSLLAIILLFPLIIILTFLVKITSPGPVFFKQERIGFMGKKFVIYKFRTMYQTKDERIHRDYVKDFITNGKSSEIESRSHIFKITNDPRITPIGKFLRRTSLDEIGQFINVLKGDMSLVGPRPPIPYEVEMYDLWHRRRFLTVKPGLTGLWQIYGRNTIAFNEMVRLDLTYANNWSLSLDFKILLKTLWAVLSMKGAY
jgi:lipopolysaccharide/colanic/teichoic acid biosynthesis glycosyltransferase/GGDEF domain-containing protein